MTVYLDGVFLINGFVDYLLLVVAGNLTGSPLRRTRILLAGAIGGIYGAVCLLPGWGFFGNVIWRGVVAVILCAAGFGVSRGLARQVAVLFLLTAAFSGLVLLLTELFSAPAAFVGNRVYYPLGMGTLVLTAGGAYGLISWALGRLEHHGGDIVPMMLEVQGRRAELTALRDTGNTLRDPITGERVAVVSRSVMKSLLPELDPALVDQPQLLFRRINEQYPGLRPRLLPYKTVGVAHGMLVGVRPEKVQVKGKRESLLIAFSAVEISDGGGYRALLGGSS